MVGGVDVDELKRSIQSASRMNARSGLLFTPGKGVGIAPPDRIATPRAGSVSGWQRDEGPIDDEGPSEVTL